jgi:hypothetical protein
MAISEKSISLESQLTLKEELLLKSLVKKTFTKTNNLNIQRNAKGLYLALTEMSKDSIKHKKQ